jgi:hypothetical protein
MIYGRKHELLFQFEMPSLCPAPVAYSAVAAVNFVALLSVNMYSIHHTKVISNCVMNSTL